MLAENIFYYLLREGMIFLMKSLILENFSRKGAPASIRLLSRFSSAIGRPEISTRLIAEGNTSSRRIDVWYIDP